MKIGFNENNLCKNFRSFNAMISAVFITYNPVLKLLDKAVDSLLEQVDYLFIIDDSASSKIFYHFLNNKIIVKPLNDNLGIAHAQNIGIQEAVNKGSDYILLSDQDTIYPKDYVSKMLPVFDNFSTACAVVPKFVDENKKTLDGFISKIPIIFHRFNPKSGQYPVFQAIASGKIIKASVLPVTGLMNDSLFIDWVDLEWCWRARARGFEIIGNADVSIDHRLGDYSRDLGYREVNLRSPMRHYYITRNAFYLAIYSRDLDFLHRLNLFVRSFRYVIGYPLLSAPRLKNLKAVLIGFIHGVTGRLGKYHI